MPIRTIKLVITSPFGMRTLKGKKRRMHRGVDLRSVDHTTWKDLDVIAPETCEVKRQGKDSYGNYFVVLEPISNAYGYKELKFIHIKKTNFGIGEVIQKGQYISKTIINGNSSALHLHFETWKDKAEDPVEYFNVMNINYMYKR